MTTYLVTGATGFIGGQLVRRLLARKGSRVVCLVREGSQHRLRERIREWGTTTRRVQPLVGDLTEPRLGLTQAQVRELKKDVTEVFHLAAVYDLASPAEVQARVNVEGTRHVVEVARALKARLHHVSSIAAAGTYRGTFTEDMFEEATGLDHPYFATKHESEGVVRREARGPYRIYRPAIVVGDSRTGEIDKVDGIYYSFKLVQKLRKALPQWVALPGYEGHPLNIVPVDFVADAIDHIAHLDDVAYDGRTFHLVDPDPHTFGEILDIVAKAAHAPRFRMRLDPMVVDLVPSSLKRLTGSLPPVDRVRKALFEGLAVPDEALQFLDWRTTFDARNAQEALAGTDISVPPFSDYAWRIWDHWERHLDPDLHRDTSLRGAIGGRNVMVTGASDGIGLQTALDCADAGAHVLLVSRTREKLEAVQEQIEQAGGEASVHPCDLSDTDDVARMAAEVVERHGGVDVLVNNAGRSIRRGVKVSLDRFHDYERTMQLNYFGAVRLIMALLPSMIERGGGHIVNVSSIGVQTGAPRFSAYVASKAALDAFSRVIGSEVVADGVHLTSVYMPLVRTKMIAPTKLYDHFPAITPETASKMITGAMIGRPKKVATGLGNTAEVAYAMMPKVVDQVLHQGYRLFPESSAAKGEKKEAEDERASTEGMAFAYALKGVHW
jgi:thioester reductase-like protein